MPQEDRLAQLQLVHGAKIMTASISTTNSSFSTTFQPTKEHMWFGCFINDTLVAVKAVSPNGCTSYFKALDNHTLQPYTLKRSYLQHLQSAPVRFVAQFRKKWMLDPYSSIAHTCDMLWLYAKDPVARLTWDTGGWFWSHSLGEQIIKVPFFQYTIKLGRALLLSQNARIPATQKH